MASSHHHHHHHQNTTSTTSGCCCAGCTHHSPPPPLPPATDPLQAFLSHFLVQQNQGFPCQCQTHQKHHFQQEQDHQQQARFVLSSLLSRINALEASLHKFSTHNHYSSSPLRNAAARVIQIHFRVFLVRRSRTLRQLKDLAIIKSRFNSLKLSISKNTHLDFQVVSQRATDLLLKLDSIRGGDPMVRDGKRSISIDLVKFLEFVDGFAVRRHEVSFKAAKNVRIVGTSNNKTRAFGSNYGDVVRDRSEIMENLRDRIEKINRFSRVSKGEDEDVELEGFHQLTDDEEEEENPRVSRNRNGHGVAQPKVKKSVSFAENGNVIWVSGNDYNNSSEPSSSEDDGQVVENLCSEVKEIKGSSKGSEDGEEAYLEDGDAQYEIVGNHKRQNGQLVFSAPLPAKMESRANLMKNRKAVKDHQVKDHQWG